MIGIYKITSPTGRVYIGQSIDVERREWEYGNIIKSKNQVRLHSSIVKYGFSEHTFEVVEECVVVKLNERERYWQDYYDVLSKKGLNCKLTGTEDKVGEHSQETRNRIGNSRRGKRHSEQTVQSMKQQRQGVGKTEEHRKRIGESLRGRIRTEEHAKKIGAANKGRKVSQEFRDKMSNLRTKYVKIKQCTLDGEVLNEYATMKEVEEQGFSKVGVRECIVGNQKIHKGFLWKII